MIDLYFLFPAVIAQVFIPTAEFAILIGIPTMKQKQKQKHIQYMCKLK